MAEVREFALPDLGEGLTEATVVRWLVAVGDVVATDQTVVEVETAKAMVDVPCPHAGVITGRYGSEGDEIMVGTPLVAVAVDAAEQSVVPSESDAAPGANGASGSQRAEDSPAAREPAAREPDADPGGSGNVLVGYGTVGESRPGARRRRRVLVPDPDATGSHGAVAGGVTAGQPDDPARVGGEATGGSTPPVEDIPPGTIDGGGRHGGAASRGPRDPRGRGQAVEPPPGRAESKPPVAVISPLVRRIAREHGIDLRGVVGSGPDGLVLRADVERVVRDRGQRPAGPTDADALATAPFEAATSSAPAAVLGGTRVPLRGMRGAAAEKLTRSRREIPDATCWVDADATGLLATRRTLNSAGSGIPLLALLARICTAALARYPELNSTVDTAAHDIVRLDAVHLGFAAQTDRGLVVPVVRDAHARNTEQLAEEMTRLTEAARAGKLSPAELTGGTFTLNNYGVFGVDGSTPIINHPEAGMIGVGRITEKPWVVEGELAVRSVVQLSFTFDHRVCDGGTAGGFLRYVADCVEQPAVLLRTL
ncbi:dihydrolipoamide acetyltransferase family protein [Streptomyces oceani]|uniref:Dihydrolipoamide acetyltransferase component of pyruvate dehydrogenase complex n=1 Tax=Streptomyces oceani TaxID=1075402 RepID=A0A1E7JWT7_9ACTN|nr:dihydrolipoamide acetyltransferase family protein [Streptomyces oceani]OEU96131.1 branched-chain alpha-keto acid dehydrogenase subunit E2 [Streptomyces oceani]